MIRSLGSPCRPTMLHDVKMGGKSELLTMAACKIIKNNENETIRNYRGSVSECAVHHEKLRGNTTKTRRTKEDEFEPEDADGTGVHDHEIDASYESEIDLSEESASDSDAECNVEEPEEPEAEPRPDIYSNSAVK